MVNRADRCSISEHVELFNGLTWSEKDAIEVGSEEESAVGET